MKNIQYDERILQAYVDDLYTGADWIVIKTVALYAVVAFLLAFVALNLVQNQAKPPMTTDSIAVMSLVLTILAGLVGWSGGSAKSFHLRLQAQQTLCQMQIEANTRTQHERAASEKDPGRSESASV